MGNQIKALCIRIASYGRWQMCIWSLPQSPEEISHGAIPSHIPVQRVLKLSDHPKTIYKEQNGEKFAVHTGGGSPTRSWLFDKASHQTKGMVLMKNLCIKQKRDIIRIGKVSSMAAPTRMSTKKVDEGAQNKRVLTK